MQITNAVRQDILAKLGTVPECTNVPTECVNEKIATIPNAGNRDSKGSRYGTRTTYARIGW